MSLVTAGRSGQEDGLNATQRQQQTLSPHQQPLGWDEDHPSTCGLPGDSPRPGSAGPIHTGLPGPADPPLPALLAVKDSSGARCPGSAVGTSKAFLPSPPSFSQELGTGEPMGAGGISAALKPCMQLG